VSEVIRSGLRLLEADEARVQALKSAMDEGIGSGFVSDFDPAKHLEELKARRHGRR
jgi:antitoxin ParD1/3/4